MDENTKKHLTCTMCGITKETYSEIVYSQGDRVCLDCKKITQEADNRAFNRDMRLKEIPQMR